jgi:dienelactone hydrolase
VIVLGGSDGGLDEFTPALLANHGYTTLGLAYFGIENLPPDLYEIPLEYFGTAITWMRNHSAVNSDQLVMMGSSRGGELALLLGSKYPEIRGVVATVPSGVAWAGVGRDVSSAARAAWTWHGAPIPFVPPGPMTRNRFSTQWFLEALKDAVGTAQAEIEVEKINGPILMVSGGDDEMWPSTQLAAIAIRRLARYHFPHSYSHLSYDGAGHAIIFPFTPSTVTQTFHPVTRSLMAFGGTPQATAAARADAWRQVLAFLAALST